MSASSGQDSVPTTVTLEIRKASPLLVLHARMQEAVVYLAQLRTLEQCLDVFTILGKLEGLLSSFGPVGKNTFRLKANSEYAGHISILI